MKFGLLCLCLSWQVLSAQPSSFTWTDFTIGMPAMKIKMPGVPQPQKAQLPNEVLSRIKRYDAFYLDDASKGIVVTLTHVTYTDDVTANQKGAIDGTNAQWRATGARVTVQTTEARIVSGYSGMEQQGSYAHGGLDYEFYDLVVTEGSKMWQVIVIIRSGDAELRKTLNQLKGSIHF